MLEVAIKMDFIVLLLSAELAGLDQMLKSEKIVKMRLSYNDLQFPPPIFFHKDNQVCAKHQHFSCNYFAVQFAPLLKWFFNIFCLDILAHIKLSTL